MFCETLHRQAMWLAALYCEILRPSFFVGLGLSVASDPLLPRILLSSQALAYEVPLLAHKRILPVWWDFHKFIFQFSKFVDVFFFKIS